METEAGTEPRTPRIVGSTEAGEERKEPPADARLWASRLQAAAHLPAVGVPVSGHCHSSPGKWIQRGMRKGLVGVGRH